MIMAQVINTNTMSLNAQRNLSTSGSSLATTIQRLSSGSRINSAKDDAAGLAISERFGTQIRGTDVAIRNANDGISLAQVAEGSLTEIGNNLQRIRELAVQSSNATNSASDRKALQSEVTQLKAEIDRVAKQSEFNGTKLLDGSFTSQLFQVGANAGQGIAIDKIVDARSTALGATDFASGKITVAAVATTAAAAPATTFGYNEVSMAGLKINGTDIGDVTVAASSTDAYANTGDAAAAGKLAVGNALAASINAKTGDHGVTATVDSAGDVVLDAWKEAPQQSRQTWQPAQPMLPALRHPRRSAWVTWTSAPSLEPSRPSRSSTTHWVRSTAPEPTSVRSRTASPRWWLIFRPPENMSASRSRIKDTDFAKETAELTRTQILQQAGTAMLAQANQVPQGVLSLLR